MKIKELEKILNEEVSFARLHPLVAVEIDEKLIVGVYGIKETIGNMKVEVAQLNFSMSYVMSLMPYSPDVTERRMVDSADVNGITFGTEDVMRLAKERMGDGYAQAEERIKEVYAAYLHQDSKVS